MREAARNIDIPLDRTWKGHVSACAMELPACGTVRVQRVKAVGTQRDAEVQSDAGATDLSTTQRLGCMPRSVAPATRADDAFDRALPFARTIPALTPEELGLTSSGVREVERLALWLEPRDRASFAASSCKPRGPAPDTLRMQAGPLTQAWQLWHQLPVPVVLCATATLCVLSAFALGLL